MPFIRQSFISLAFRRQAVVPGQLNSQDPAVVVSSTHLSALARLDFHGQNWHPEIVMNEKQSMRPLQEAQVPPSSLLSETLPTGAPCWQSCTSTRVPEREIHATGRMGSVRFPRAVVARSPFTPTPSMALQFGSTSRPRLAKCPRSRQRNFAELRRRGAMTGIHAAIGALYDQLERQGLLQDDRCTLSYLANRLRLEEARASSADGAQGSVRFWQEKIDRLASRPAG